MLRRLAPLLFLLFTLNIACASAGPGLQMANTVAMGVACGMAAANNTPCTPQTALVEIAAAQKEIMQAMAKEAAKNGDPAVVAALLKGLEANAAAQRELAEQVMRLAEKPAASPGPTTTAPPAATVAPSGSSSTEPPPTSLPPTPPSSSP